MARQHTSPLLIDPITGIVIPLPRRAGQEEGKTVAEAEIQQLIHRYPTCLPILEIDPMFRGPVPICMELNTPAGPIDNFMVTPSGLPVLAECKLWRNPEARREVVGQILDYAKELSRWSSSDLQREVSRRLGQDGNVLLDLVRKANPEVDEQEFNDSLTTNLRRGRFLLLIVGDGIREGVEAIAEYLRTHAGLHFSLGLVELPFYTMPDGSRLVAPRVLLRTTIVTRSVVALPDGYAIQEPGDADAAQDDDPERTTLQNEQQRFWSEFLPFLKLDDPEQEIPKPFRMGYITFGLPAPGGSSWLTVYRDLSKQEVGIFLSSGRNTAGEYAMNLIADDWNDIQGQLAGTARLTENDGRPRIFDSMKFGPLDQKAVRDKAFAWLAERVNTFVNVLRPRVRSAVSDYQGQNK